MVSTVDLKIATINGMFPGPIIIDQACVPAGLQY